jgi:hypothetical protein
MYMNGKHWIGLDYKVASDYTYGSPEYYRTLLRQSFGMPKLLPGESNENSEQITNRQNISHQRDDEGYMSGIIRKGKRRFK